MSKICVVVSAYNVEKHIITTLNSLLMQSKKDFELIIVNDGSTDNTLNVISGIMKNSCIGKYEIINKTNGGVSSARNVGLLSSSSDYLFFLDGDDYVSHNFIETIEEELNNESVDVIAWAYDTVKEDKTTISKFSERYAFASSELTGIEILTKCINKQFWIWTCSAIFRRELIMNHGVKYTEGCSNGEDQEFLFKILSHASKIKLLDQTLSYYVQRGNSITNTYTLKKFDTINAIDRTAVYLGKSEIKKIREISEIIRTYYAMDNFLAIFRLSVEQVIYRDSISINDSVKRITHDIENGVPNIFNELRNKIRMIEERKGKKKLFKLQLYKLFTKNPSMYYMIMLILKSTKIF